MTIEEFYNKIGGNAEGVLKRLGGESMARRFINKFSEDSTFKNLKSAMENGDVDAAFRAAHTLKGICMNLGFDNLYEVSANITETLRTKEIDKAAGELPEVEKCYDELISCIQEINI